MSRTVKDQKIKASAQLVEQRRGSRTRLDRGVDCRGAERERTTEEITVPGRQCIGAMCGRRRQPPAVDQPARKRMLLRKCKHSVAHPSAGTAFGCNEVRRTRRVQNVFVGGLNSLVVISLQERRRRPVAHNPRELPAKIVGVLDSAVATARTE